MCIRDRDYVIVNVGLKSEAVIPADQFKNEKGEIGALLELAEKYRCNECGFAGRSFYWHCPACHAWDSFEAYAIVKLG